ncbi:endonuclease MutS2 [Levilactobacillus bambusae]|uniref:Endonuclease MutS2 n=1 Tax=Levilactobacillus bambusae TaxID=2024736 RepID=A0A2V1MWZ3_9LACO|nr:endonuclease MutS2 [Levilactobacillus bambusae]PWF99590.1 endonuclease MutS2 [Levilactobacillus bambusae]
MDKKTLSIMEYDRVKQKLNRYLVSASGKHEVAKLEPISDELQLQDWIDETKDGADIYRLMSGVPMPKLDDIHPHMKRLEIDATLNGSELAQISRVLQTVNSVRHFFADLKDKEIELRRLYGVAETLTALPDINRRLKTAIEGDGRITDDASSDLKTIRNRITHTEGEIRSTMERFTRGKDTRYLSDAVVTIRDDRYVIPVKAEYKQRFGGIVHDQSQTGQTLYIEPEAVVGLNNRLRSDQLAERDEEQRILAELSDLIRPYSNEIAQNAVILGHLDFVNAKAKYAHALGATEPVISTDNQVSLRQARHPLIDPAKVVANDLELGGEYKAIIVTGPNTGGKTITLKTLGLLQFMGQSGLFIPANEHSQIGLFDNIFAEIGDEQSIEQSLSTFSAHMKTVIDILSQADSRSLILLDELGSGTDPKEGAALAMAILDQIGTLGSEVVATTHYPELKAYAYNRPETINASMEFDTATLQPTYRFLTGIPGSSNALDIAQRLGLDATVVAEARGLTDQDSQDLNAMISDLTAEKRAAEREAEELAVQLDEAQQLHDDLKNQFEQYEKNREKLVNQAKEQANQIVANTREKADQIISDIRKKQLTVGQSVVKENELIDTKGQINALEQHPELKKNKVLQREKNKHDFHKGDEVIVKSYGQQGVLMQQLDKSHWEVQLGILKMKVAVDDLERITQTNQQKQKQPRTSVKRTASSGMSPTLDLRGHRYEEAIQELDRYIDSALLAGYPQVTIIHGKGTGALRKGVTDYLKRNKRVKSFGFSPANAGGDGSTIVKF